MASVLVGSLGLVAVLAWQAHRAARSQRAIAERVLRDYATLAAEELVRRAAGRVGYAGCYPLIRAVRAAAAGADPAPSPAAVASRLGEPEREALGLARSFFRSGPGGGLAVSEPLEPEVATWLGERLAGLTPAELAQGPGYGVLHRGGPPRPVRFVVSALDGPEAEAPSFAGFEVEEAALAQWIAQAVAMGPLLPASLVPPEVASEALDLAVVGEGGAEILKARGYWSPDLGVEVPFGSSYGGVLEGLSVRAWVDPEAAPRLVIGGLPRSRLPLLAVQLAVAVVLTAAGILLLRRERALAALRLDFVSRVSHELRTPLAQIRLFAETLLLGRVRSQEEARRSLSIIDREARRLAHLVENVLQFSRGERGAVRLAPQPCELAPLVEEVLAGFAPLAGAAQFGVVGRLEPGVSAAVDADALRQVLLNLLDNAVKHAPLGRTVTVRLEPRPAGGAVLAVEDQGPGIPPAERQRIFRPFERGGGDRGSAVAGAGIGLAVVRELVEAQGGRAWVEDAGGGGARFVVELPAARKGAAG